MPIIAADAVTWARQHHHLWTGRRGGRPIGTIERGRRFTFVGVDGTRHPGHRTLEAAQAAAQRGRAPVARAHAGARAVMLASSAVVASAVTLAVTAGTLLR